MKYKKILTILAILITKNPCHLFAQTVIKEHKIDSLIESNERYQKQDLIKLKLLNALVFAYPNVNPTKGIETGELAINLAQKLNNQLHLAEAYNNKGLNHAGKSDYPTAMELYEKALALNNSMKNTFGIAHNTFNVGRIFQLKGEGKKAKEQYEKALTLFESITDKAGIAKCYNGIGGTISLSDNNKAMEYYQKALAINEQIGNKSGIAINLGNIGAVYNSLSEFQKALECYKKALTINEQIGNKSNLAMNHNYSGDVYNNLNDHTKALESYKKALSIYMQVDNKNGIASAHGKIGSVFLRTSAYQLSLESFQKALSTYEQIGNKRGIAVCHHFIGSIFIYLSENTKALEFFQKALVVNQEIDNKNEIAANLSNIGLVYSDIPNYSLALESFQKAHVIHEQMGNKEGMAANLDNIGNVYSNLSDYTHALEYYQKALSINEQIDNKMFIAGNLCNIGNLYRDAPDSVLIKKGVAPTNRYEKALECQNKALKIARESEEISREKEVWQNLSTTYEKQGNYTKAYDAYKQYIILRDSVESEKIKDQIERKTMQYEFDKKETALRFDQQLTQEKLIQSQQEAALGKQALLLTKKEKDLQHLEYLKTQAELHQQKIAGEKQVALNGKKDVELQLLGKASELKQTELNLSKAEVKSKNQQRNAFMVGFAVVLLFAGVFFRQRNKIGKEKNISDKERKRSDELLLNILPAEVAEELKAKGSADAQLMDEVTVLFTDFKGFTQLSEKLSPKELVAEINECFSAFDNIMLKHGVEKIKTIGDAYMAAGGLPTANTTHANDVVLAALDIQQFMHEHKAMKEASGQLFFEIRIGVHTGPVVAGIVGIKKFAYDIWGDTVNTASRMESSGEVGKVNISGTTYEMVKDKFNCEHRGKIQAKGKGEIDMYFVGVKSDHSTGSG